MSNSPSDDLIGAAPSAGLGGQSHEPRMISIGDALAPEAPFSLRDSGIDPDTLADLTLKLAHTVPQFTAEWATQRLCLPLGKVEELLDQLKTDKMIEILGQDEALNYRFAITGRGGERARRLLEICGYIGPAPVSLEAYSAFLDWQFRHLPAVSLQKVAAAISELVLSEQAVQIAGLAASSGRSLLLYGPPGNGKTSVGRLLHNALEGNLWIPHCISIGSNIIRVFDPQCHDCVHLDLPPKEARKIDHRWVQVRRPFIIVGGELTINDLDLGYSRELRYYEAPLHLKANGGIFLLDDFGCQRVEPGQLLNRWVIPLERQIDYLTLQTGQKLQVPLKHMLVVSTNLNPYELLDPAFMRRLGYRLHLGNPSPEAYTRIFQRYASGKGVAVPPGLIERLIARYDAEGRPARACEPRDLIERAHDLCRCKDQPLTLNEDIMALAWRGYFGEDPGAK